ncbi:hypothetical protein CC2G_007664 [Coprinopsis cinerea AmutBmut pab1-1]|nr:hypothetical protein CC2G_007664 [Coprinopsis cinerea AmutBmut pab1-1]
MPPFTSLESTLIRIPFDSAVRRDPSGLRHFLLRSSETLKDVVIRLTPMGLALQPAAEEPVCEWLAECVADPGCFSNVKRLDICPTNLPAGIDILNRCISNSHRQMTEFRVRDRYLKTEEAVALSKTLSACPNLTTLHLNIFQLSHNVFDAFARDLPALRILQLWIGEPSSMVSTNTSTTLETFRKDMETRRYMDWKLWDLTIWESGHDLDSETMLTLMRSIPSLKSFGAKFED